DVVGSERLMQSVGENYRKIRNTFRFLLGNLNGFDPVRDALTFAEMYEIDRYMLLRMAELSENTRQWYEEFAFHRIYHELHNFCTVELSDEYLDILKDRLYTAAPRSRARRSAQTAIWRIGEALVRLLAPIMTFTAEEVWQHLPGVSQRSESVHLALFPLAEEVTGALDAAERGRIPAIREEWEKLLAVRQEVFQALEQARREKQS